MKNQHPDTVTTPYTDMEKKASNYYTFISIAHRYAGKTFDYGPDLKVNMNEVHTLIDVYDNPGITVTELAARSFRSKSAVSQALKKLEDKGLIFRNISNADAKIVHLFTTSAGAKLCFSQKISDIEAINRNNKRLLERCTPEEIESFYKIIDVYLDIIYRDLNTADQGPE